MAPMKGKAVRGRTWSLGSKIGAYWVLVLGLVCARAVYAKDCSFNFDTAVTLAQDLFARL